MDLYLKLNTQAAGRDKIIRLIQYLSRATWDLLQKYANGHEHLIDKLKSLEFTLSSFRKLLRLGKCLDVLYSSLSSIHYPDVSIRVTLTLSKISQALFLLSDHIIWFARSGLVSNINTEKWNKTANKYWLLSITMNLVRDLYEITNILSQNKQLILHSKTNKNDCKQSFTEIVPIVVNGFTCVQSHKDVFIDTVKNSCDFFIPMTALGFTKLSPGVIGMLGVVSSIAGIIPLVRPVFKLTPS